jgi:hypothetical protein
MNEEYRYYRTIGKHNYEVSNFGNVKKDGRIIPYEELSSWGIYKELYWHITVHKAVATLFLDNPDNKPEIDHIDGNSLNNNVNNLRWVTHSENMCNPITKQRRIIAMKQYYSDKSNRDKISLKMKEYCQTEAGKEHIKRMTELSPISKKGYVKSKEHIKKITEKIRGQKRTDEQKQLISNRTKESMKDPNIRLKCIEGGLHTKGLKWMNNKKLAIRVEPTEIDKYIKLGYSLGRGKIHF